MLRFLAPVTLTLLASGWLVGCPAPEDPHHPKRPLPSYAGRAVELFDDAIEARAIGLEVDTPSAPRADPLLRERTQVGDAVMRVKVVDVTGFSDDSGATYEVSFHVVEKLFGPYPPGDPFRVRVGKNSPALGSVKTFERRLSNMGFVAFVRLFVRPDGDPELHFHLAPDTKDEVLAVRDAAALNEVTVRQQ